MFILNAFCCGTQEPQSNSSTKSKTIRKVLTDQSNLNRNDPPTPIDTDCKKINQTAKISISEAVTPTFVKPQIGDQTIKSDQCNPGSNITSIDEQLSEKFASPISFGNIQSNQKQNDPFTNMSKNFHGCDFIENDVKQWSVKDVLKFLTKIGMKNYNHSFYKNKIKGKDLLSLTEKELKSDLQIQDKDIKTFTLYIQLLNQRAQREKKEKGLSRTFSGRRKKISLYKTHSNTYSTRKILALVKNPIVQDSQEDNYDHHGKRENKTTKDMYSTANLSDLLTN